MRIFYGNVFGQSPDYSEFDGNDWQPQTSEP